MLEAKVSDTPASMLSTMTRMSHCIFGKPESSSFPKRQFESCSQLETTSAMIFCIPTLIKASRPATVLAPGPLPPPPPAAAADDGAANMLFFGVAPSVDIAKQLSPSKSLQSTLEHLISKVVTVDVEVASEMSVIDESRMCLETSNRARISSFLSFLYLA